MAIYRTYFLIVVTVFALYELLFFYIVRPYYLSVLSAEKNEDTPVPQVAFEVVYLLILVLGLAVSVTSSISPYLVWGIVLLIYGLYIKKSPGAFFLASALFFNMHRNLKLKEQLRYQTNTIFAICIISSAVFVPLSFYIHSV